MRGTIERSPVPVTCKLRKVSGSDPQETVNLARRLEAVGCAMVCIHGRTLVSHFEVFFLVGTTRMDFGIGGKRSPSKGGRLGRHRWHKKGSSHSWY